MSQINKAILLPLLTAIALFIKEAFGYDIPVEWINTTADVVMFIIMILGIFIHPKKQERVTAYDFGDDGPAV